MTIYKIFLLEDEKDLGRLYKKKLEKEGFEVQWAQNFSEAEKILTSFIPDLALLDHGLRGESKTGTDLLRQIRITNTEMPVFLLSNYDQPELRHAAEVGGVTKYLLKIDAGPRIIVPLIQKFFQEQNALEEKS